MRSVSGVPISGQRITKPVIIAILLFVISGLGVYQAFSKDDSPPSSTDIKIFGQSELLIGSQASIRIVAVNYQTETPVPNVRINISLADPKNKSVAHNLFTGQTDHSGTLNCAFIVPPVTGGDYEIVIKNEAEPTKSTAYPVKLKSAYAVYLSTDKPIYQPGQEMHIRALALHKTTLQPITGKPVILEVLDSRGNKVMKKNLTTSKFGIVSSIFSLADEINMGSYTVRAIVENEPPVEKTVNVDKYVLPRFKISFNTDKKYYLPKETVKCTLRADYTYGKPVANGKVTIKASTFDYEFRQFGEWTGSTDAKGETTEFTFNLPDYFVGQPLLHGKGMVKFDILVIDDTDHKEDAANTVTVTDASINITVIPESGSVVPGIENIIYIAATYPDGSPAKNTKLSVEAVELSVKSVLITDDLGIASIKLTSAKTGTTLKVSAQDEQGNKAEKTQVLSTDPSAGEDGLLIRTDKSLYKVGETLYLSILSTRPAGPVYADFIKDKQTVLTKTVELKNGQGKLEFNLTPELFGVLEINAYQIRKSLNIIRDTTRVFVSPAQELAIRMTPGKSVYLPGEDNVSIDFAVTLNNQPVLAALGIWAVDEAVFAKAEQDPGLAKIFFMLEKEVMKPRWEIHDYSLNDIVIDKDPPNRNAPLVGDGADASRKQLAARVLFAAIDEANSLPVRLSSRQKEMEKELGEKAVRIFTAYSDHLTKVYPEIQNTDLKQLVTRGLVKNAAELQDPWGNNYILVGHSHLHSFGPDKTDNTPDDIDIAAEGFRLKTIYDDKTTAALFAQYKLVTAAIAKYRSLVAVLTKDLHGLADAELVKPNDMLDPWGTAFIADLRGECGCDDYPHNNEIASAGPDKKFGTADDIRIMSDCSLQTTAQLTNEQQDALKANAKKVVKAIAGYKKLRRNEAQVTGDYSAIYKKGLLKKDQTSDPWGNTIFWLNDQQLLSVGKDGKKDTPDDLLLIGDIIQIKELPDAGLSARLQAQVQALKQVIQQYYQTRASRDVNTWVKEDLLKPDDTTDPWGYQLSFQGYYVLGHRPDAKAQTGPDWTVTYYVTIQREDEKKAGLVYGQGSSPRGRHAKGDEKNKLGDIPIIGALMPSTSAPKPQEGLMMAESEVELLNKDFPDAPVKMLEEFKESGSGMYDTIGIGGGMGGGRGRRGGRRLMAKLSSQGDDDAGGVVGGPRLRQDFRETLFVLPQLITNEQGIARYTIPRLADNITDWRISTFANSLSGHLGSSTVHLKAFQDFFIDIDLPVALTQNDELSVPVIIKNYLKTPQRIVLSLKQGSAATAWFELMDKENTRTIDIDAESGKAEYFRIKARNVGRKQPLQFEARAIGSNFGDAVLRYVEVRPDGKEVVANYSETVSSERMADKTVTIPANAIAGASAMFVKLYPGVFSQVLEGMEKILQMPSGCFEQTSSSTYPNILAMDYLKSTSQSKPEIELQARTYISHGYQRLLSFEVQGGGFEWFGHAPANQVLTAYGLMEFADMARVFDEVDSAVINRTAQWLMSKQQPDGSWLPDAAYLHAEAWGRIQGKNLLVTAYIAWCLAESNCSDTARLAKALEYIKSQVTADKTQGLDPYIIGLCANALLIVNKADETGLQLLKYLDDTKIKKDKTAFWKGTSTVTYASGQSADIETTAMIALAFLKAQAYHETVRSVLDFITQSKDPNGTWHSTQGTILALNALLRSQPAKSEPINAEITVLVNNQQAAAEVIDPSEWDVVRTIDLRKYAQPGQSNVQVKFAGKGAMMYQLVSRYYIPAQESPKSELMTIEVNYDRTQLATNDILKCNVWVQANRPGIAKMIIVDLSLPPGFALLDQGEFAELVGGKKISKFSQTARQMILYLDELSSDRPLEFAYHLKAKYPLKVKAPSSRVYEYYDPARESFSKPATLEVK